MGAIKRTSIIVHDQILRAAPKVAADLAQRQPENLCNFEFGNDTGVTFNLDIHGTVGTADSFYVTCKFQKGMGDRAGAGHSQINWVDLQPEQVKTMVLEGRDWYFGAAGSSTNYNYVLNPSKEGDASGSSLDSGTGGTSAITSVTGTAGNGTKFARQTWSTATTDVSGGTLGSPTGTAKPIVAGQVYSGQIKCQPTNSAGAQRLRVGIQWIDSGGANIASGSGGLVYGTSTVVYTADGWTLLKVENVTAPTGAVKGRLVCRSVAGASGVPWAVGDTLDTDSEQINDGPVALSYFDGEPTNGGAWTATARNSASVQSIVAGTDGIVCRNTDNPDTTPVMVSRTIRGFGRFVAVYLTVVAVNPSRQVVDGNGNVTTQGFGIRYSLHTEY